MSAKAVSTALPILLLLSAACGGGGQAAPAAPAAPAASTTALPPRGPMPSGVSWQGSWSTTFGELTLIEGTFTAIPEATVGGVYSYVAQGNTIKGTIAGRQDGNYLIAVWIEDRVGEQHRGRAVFVMSGDGRSYAGSWGNGDSHDNAGEWSGTRADP